MGECPLHAQERADGWQILRCWHRGPLAIHEIQHVAYAQHLVELQVYEPADASGWLGALAGEGEDLVAAWERYVAAARAGTPILTFPDPAPEALAVLAAHGLTPRWELDAWQWPPAGAPRERGPA